MLIEQAKIIVDEMEHQGYDAEVREEYSGRGMYGKTTAAIVTENPLMVAFCAGVCAGEGGMIADEYFDPDSLRTDSMGFSQTIIY